MGHMGTYMVHVPLHVSGLILHGAFQTKFLGILYHKLSTFMLIRRDAGSFKCYFWIFEQLPWFWTWWTWVGHHIMALWWGLSLGFLSYQLESYQILWTGERSYQELKDATLFGLISDKSAEIWGSEYSNFGQFSILAMAFVFDFCMQISQVMLLLIENLLISLEIVTFGQDFAWSHNFCLPAILGLITSIIFS